MSGFVAKDRVEPLSYDFSPHGGKGVIEEPSNKMIEEFRSSLFSVTADAAKTVEAATKTESIVDRIRILSEADQVTHEMDIAMLQAVATVCSHNPSTEEIQALPYRLQRAFVGWIVGELLSPEA